MEVCSAYVLRFEGDAAGLVDIAEFAGTHKQGVTVAEFIDLSIIGRYDELAGFVDKTVTLLRGIDVEHAHTAETIGEIIEICVCR